MPTIPNGAEPEVAFISGVTDAGKVAGIAYGTWQKPKSPAIYDTAKSKEAKWGSTTFGSSGGTVTYGFDANWTPHERDDITACLAAWSAVANVKFELGSSGTKIRFSAANERAKSVDSSVYRSVPADVGSDVAGTIVRADIRIGVKPDGTGDFGWQWVVQEIGEALGLGHGGPYPFRRPEEPEKQFSAYDSRLWTLMSSINPTTNAKFSDAYPVTGTFWGSASDYTYGPTTPMILDILAIQRIYGAPTSGPLVSGGQVFGFNSNIEGPVKQFFDFRVNTDPVITIWDAGTNNTLDLSGFFVSSTVNLNPGTFSSANRMRNNIAIAMDTVIEKAVGGPSNDRFTGSAANNVFVGNKGDDTIDGGAGVDTAIFSGQRSQYTLTALKDNGVQVAGPDGTDVLKNVEHLKFDDQTVDWPLRGSDADDYANALADQSSPLGQVLLGGSATGNLESKGDRDWYAVELKGSTVYTIELTGSQHGGGTLANPLVRLHNSAGTVVAENDDIESGSNRDSQISFVPSTSGTYYVEAGASGDNLTGTYEISLRSPGSQTDDFANSLTDATRPVGLLTVGASGLGNLEVPTDRDWFRVSLTAGETYVIGLTGTPGGDGKLNPYLRLHDSTGAVVDENDDVITGDSFDSELVFQATETGFYYIESGSYQDRYSGTYTVNVSWTRETDDFANSPHDSSRPLGLMVIGGSTTGSLETVVDRDWFSVQLTAGTTYRFSLTGVEKGGGTLKDPLLILHDADGYAIAANDDSEPGVTLDSALDFFVAESGTYYVEAASFSHLYTGTYTIGVAASKTIDDLITGLYAGYCNRAPDAEGEAYWVEQLLGGMGLAQIAQSFAVQAETEGVYGFLSNPNLADGAAVHSFIAEVYANLLNRNPDAGGEAYWTQQLKSGRPTGMAILDIISGARGDDVLVVKNKVAVGGYYVTQTLNNQVAMTAESARDALQGVGPGTASVETAKAKVDAYISATLFPDDLPVLGIAPNTERDF